MLEALENRFRCRKVLLQELFGYLGDPADAVPAALYLYGHAGTGKTAIIKYLFKLLQTQYKKKVNTIHLDLVECYTTRLLLENIIDSLIVNNFLEMDAENLRCDTVKDFIDILSALKRPAPTILIALDHAERLRDMDANLLPVLLRLREFTALNIGLVLISQLPYEKYYGKCGQPDVLILHAPQYSKNELLEILHADLKQIKVQMTQKLKTQAINAEEFENRQFLIEHITEDFFNNYLNVFLSVFLKACRQLPELRITSRNCFSIYMQPVLDGTVQPTDVSRLWRHIAAPLSNALSKVYLRLDDPFANTNDANNVCEIVKSLELPYYGKYLLIAAFLASYNSAKSDKRLFVKHHGKQKKRMQSVNAKAKVVEKMSTSVGPKSFGIDRLLAIFYAIIEEKVGLTCNLLSQISTLVHLKLLTFVSGERNIMDGTAKLQCTISLEFVLYLGKVVGFNVRQYLCDFM